ncbi:MAG: penicillin-binding transpeptidase domain-containing protein [bacterium]
MPSIPKKTVLRSGSLERYWRVYVVQFGLYFSFAGICGRLLQIQVMNHEKYQQMAAEQYTYESTQKAPRGLIYDRTGITIAFNKLRYDLGVYTRAVDDHERLAEKLAGLLSLSTDTILGKLKNVSSYTLIQRGLDEEQAKIIDVLKLPGVTISRANDRMYPFDEKLAQVIGFSDIDGVGISGIELQFDELLKGNDGWMLLQRDAKGKKIMPIAAQTKASQSGANIVLTIDQVLQAIVENELTRAVERFNARGGTAIITNPGTGEILAMASAPGFDANEAKRRPEAWRIRAITDIFEPGSTFKIVTMMVALSDSIMNTEDIVFCENGTLELFGETINDPKSHGWLSFKNVFKYSSNIGTAKIALKIGRERLFEAARDFGFGTQTGIELPGEVAGILKKPSQWSRFSVAAISYGHEIAVTALQMAMAYGAVANGGMLMRPTIVKEIHDRDGKILFESGPQVIRHVMTPRVAQQMTDILVEVVEQGTGKMARIEGVSLAGKTGTAQKPKVGKIGYSKSKYVASFVGFTPAEQAQLLIYVAIDEPYPVHGGGSVAAPVVRNILQRIIKIPGKAAPHKRTRPDDQHMAENQVIPDIAGHDLVTAERILDELDIAYEIQGEGAIIQSQLTTNAPGKGGRLKVLLILGPDETQSEYAVMPNLVGLSLRKAIVELSGRGLQAKVLGSGQVVKQQPGKGAKIRVGARCYLQCRPRFSVKLLGN